MCAKSILNLMLCAALWASATPAHAAGSGHAEFLEAADQTLGMAILSARVDGNGNLVAGAGAVSAVYNSGKYVVTFNRPIEECVSVANSLIVPLISRSLPNNDAVTVTFLAHDGSAAADLFQVLVFCPR